MRIRALALVGLAAVGLAPLSLFAVASIARSERTAVAEVQGGNARLAASVAHRLAAYAAAEAELLRTIGTAAAYAADEDAQSVLDVYALAHPHLHDISVYRADGSRLAGPGIEAAGPLVAAALAGDSAQGAVTPAGDMELGGFAHTQHIAEPIAVAGMNRGAVVARMDLVYVWKPINRIRVGARGFARLMSMDGTLLAHGDPEERRYVFAGARDADASIAAGALLRVPVVNLQGEPVVASMALVPAKPWAVLVEQPAVEAFAPARAMKRDLAVLGGIALLVAVVGGVVSGRRVVGGLEQLRRHTGVLAAGELDARVQPVTRVTEIRALAGALNEMSASIKRMHDEARARERLSTFARVAAGLAHDLRQPIEAVRSACAQLVAAPEDPAAKDLFAWVNERELPRLKRYVDDLQRIAHDGDVRLDFEELDPAGLAEEMTLDLRSNPKWGGVRFEAAGQAEPLVADRGLLRRAVFNLAANGADACVGRGRTGAVRIEVSDTGDRGACVLRVVDTGGGMSSDALARLVEGDFHSTKRSSGVGLGFGVARHVATAHGGDIEARTELGVGSAIELRIPRRTIGEAPALAGTERDPGGGDARLLA